MLQRVPVAARAGLLQEQMAVPVEWQKEGRGMRGRPARLGVGSEGLASG